MKKLFNIWNWLVVLTLCAGMSSCSGVEQEIIVSFSDIVGKWQLYEATPSDGYDPCDFESWYEYESDGTFTTFDECDNSITTGMWGIGGETEDILTIIFDDSPLSLVSTIISITDNELVLETTLFGVTVTTKFKRLEL